MKITLPLPPSTNAVSEGRAAHYQKKAYQERAWVAAIQQRVPLHDPPERVTVRMHFYVHNLRDEDNRDTSVKWILDALKQKQRGSLAWRQGAYDQRGYFIDDDPRHMTLGRITQEILRSHKRAVIWLTELEAK